MLPQLLESDLPASMPRSTSGLCPSFRYTFLFDMWYWHCRTAEASIGRHSKSRTTEKQHFFKQYRGADQCQDNLDQAQGAMKRPHIGSAISFPCPPPWKTPTCSSKDPYMPSKLPPTIAPNSWQHGALRTVCRSRFVQLFPFSSPSLPWPKAAAPAHATPRSPPWQHFCVPQGKREKKGSFVPSDRALEHY